MNKEITGNRTKNIPMRIVSLLLIMLSLINMCACGKSSGSSELSEPSGKYYSETMDGIYYEFDGESTCYLHFENKKACVEYKYVVNKEDTDELVDNDGAVHKTYVIHITDINSSGSHKLIFDSYDDSIYDPDIGLFSK